MGCGASTIRASDLPLKEAHGHGVATPSSPSGPGAGQRSCGVAEACLAKSTAGSTVTYPLDEPSTPHESLPGAVGTGDTRESVHRQALFHLLDTNGSGILEQDEVTPESISVEARRIFYKLLDPSDSGMLNTEELVEMLLEIGSEHLDLEAVNALVRTVDLNEDGTIGAQEFADLLNAPPPPPEGQLPHLVLHFDINQTVLMMDSITNSSQSQLLSEVLSNAAWGTVNTSRGTPSWEANLDEPPSLVAPSKGLKTYCQFVREYVPKEEQRRSLRTFTDHGCPGESFHPHVGRLADFLRLPTYVISKADTEFLESIGLHHHNHLLLPSFLMAIRRLKQMGRSFSVCFRTFGCDLSTIAREFNAVCENRHPLFLHGGAAPDSEDQDVVLDGSDGLPDMRLDLTPGGGGLGTWVRCGDKLSLVLGTMEQPPLEEANPESLAAYYAAHLPDGQKVHISKGVEESWDKLRSLLHESGRGRTMGLRDYYDGWEAVGRSPEGGKPLLIETLNSRLLQIFFDDHILANDAHIVDVRAADMPGRPTLPIGAVMHTHLVRAEPLKSIVEPDYFIEAIEAAERNRRAMLHRRRMLAECIADYARVVAVTKSDVRMKRRAAKLTPGPIPTLYVPHAKFVDRASNANSFDDDEYEDVMSHEHSKSKIDPHTPVSGRCSTATHSSQTLSRARSPCPRCGSGDDCDASARTVSARASEHC